MIGSSKNKRENYPRKCFSTQERETRVKFNPGLSANRPSNNWAPDSKSLEGFRIPWAVFWIPNSRIPDSISKIFPDSGFRIPLHGAKRGWQKKKQWRCVIPCSYQLWITSLPRFDDCPLYHRWLLQQATCSALGGIGTGRMKITSGSHMTLQLMDMLLTPLAANVLRGNTWQVRNPPLL